MLLLFSTPPLLSPAFSTLDCKKKTCYTVGMKDIDLVLSALRAIRSPRVSSEYDLHDLVAAALSQAGLPVCHEAPIGPRRRIDFLCGRIGIEIKRSRPAPSVLLRQLRGYAESPQVDELIVICEHLPRLPATVCGKPLHALSLNRLWGIAL